MTTLNRLGPFGQGKATIAIAANVAVKWDTTPGNIVVCGAGDIPIGYTNDAIAAGAIGQFVRAGGGAEVYVTAAGVSAGDLLKTAASGALAQETTPTTPTAYTVAQAQTATDADGKVLASSMR